MTLSRQLGLLATLTALTLGCSSSPAAAPHPQQQAAQPKPAQARPTSTPYAGDLSIFDYPDRDKKLEIERVMTLLKIHSGSTVADLGAGSGWFTVRAAKRVGPTGTVFAEDINPATAPYIEARAAKAGLKNIRTVIDQPGAFNLPANSLNAALILKTYHEYAAPIPTMQSLLPALKPGALIGIIDRNGTGSGTDHGVPQATVEREMDLAGFRKVAMYDFTKKDGQDYFLIFTAK